MMLKSIAEYGSIDLSLFIPHLGGTNNGVTYEYNLDNTCKISGRTSGTSYNNIFNSGANSLPPYVEPNKTYKIKYNGIHTKLRIYFYIDGTLQTSANIFASDGEITMPANLTGLIIRIDADKNVDIDETVDFKMFLYEIPTIVADRLNYFVPKFIKWIKGSNSTKPEVTYTWNGDELHIVAETGDTNNFLNCYASSTQLPEGLSPGKQYCLVFNAEKIRAKLYYYTESDGPYFICESYHSFYFSLPDIATGMIIRVDPDRNSIIDEYIKIGLCDGVTDLINGTTYINYGYGYEENLSCDDFTSAGSYFVSKSGSYISMSDFAWDAAGWLLVVPYNSTFIFQLALPYDVNNYSISYRVKQNTTWTNWLPLTSGETVYEYTTIEKGTYQNTYNITTTPTITTDSNGWLQPIDIESSDESNKTDMTGPIMSMLTDTGYCHLAPGIYYVSGSINMPAGSMLEGCGNKTIIRLLSSVSNGYIVKPSSDCIIKNIRFSGSYSEIDISSGDIGGRNGIYCTASANRHNMVQNCFFDGLSSAIYQYDNGGSTHGYIYMQQCFISNCTVGINIDKYSEYNKYTDVVINKCYYACINNGGNNVFTSCTFHGTIGFMIDNSSGTKNNNAHGSVVGCTFNHIDNWNRSSTLGGGDAIKIIDTANGFIFTGCQIWYGAINIQNSRGIQISNTLIGGNTPSITITGSTPVFFSNCIFHQTPSISDTASSKFINCFLDSTGSEI